MALGAKTPASLHTKAAAALTTAYTGWTIDLDVTAFRSLAFLWSYVYSSATSLEVLVHRSDDGTTYYPDQRINSSNEMEDDAVTKAPGASDSGALLIDCSDCRFLRIAAKRTGGSASDTLAGEVIAGG